MLNLILSHLSQIIKIKFQLHCFKLITGKKNKKIGFKQIRIRQRHKKVKQFK